MNDITMNDTMRKLRLTYIHEYPQNPVSSGTFFILMLFYGRAAALKDLAI